MSNDGACIACGEPTENTEHVCTDCTAGARARLRVRALTDDELMAKHEGGDPRPSARAEGSNVAIAGELAVDPETVRRARQAELAERGLMQVDRRRKREERAAEKDSELLARTPSSDVDLHHLPVAELHTVVPAGSVDVIFTDPPYPREYLPAWGELAAFAAHALKPSGVLVAMSGQSYLPEVMVSLGEHLTYRWTVAYLMPGADTTIWPRKVKTRWKPVLVYGAAEEWLNIDVVHADTLQAQDDRLHQWGQQAPGVVRLLEPFVKPGYVVCDPFVGGGTSALAARVHGCAFIGADSDATQLDTTRERVDGRRAA